MPRVFLIGPGVRGTSAYDTSQSILRHSGLEELFFQKLRLVSFGSQLVHDFLVFFQERWMGRGVL